MVKSQEVTLKKSRLPATELGTDKSQYGGYITRHWNGMNSHWMFWIGGLSWRFSVSSFCDIWKLTFCDFITFFLLFAKSYPLIFLMCFIRGIIAYLCLNMINFDAVDFSGHRSKEVISFFWRSVYIQHTEVIVQWNLGIKRSDITKPSYNKVILLVPALYISSFFYPDIMRNLI